MYVLKLTKGEPKFCSWCCCLLLAAGCCCCCWLLLLVMFVYTHTYTNTNTHTYTYTCAWTCIVFHRVDTYTLYCMFYLCLHQIAEDPLLLLARRRLQLLSQVRIQPHVHTHCAISLFYNLLPLQQPARSHPRVMGRHDVCELESECGLCKEVVDGFLLDACCRGMGLHAVEMLSNRDKTLRVGI